MEVVACVISDELMKMNDKEMLEDLIRSAINQAVQKARRGRGRTSKMASGLGLACRRGCSCRRNCIAWVSRQASRESCSPVLN